jgi:hypothetical protein
MERQKSPSNHCTSSFCYTDCSSTPSKKANGGPTSLIDFEGELGGSHVSATSSKSDDGTGNLLDDLAGLSFNSPTSFGQGGSIALGKDTSTWPTD